MAYNKKELLDKSIEVVKKDRLIFFADIFAKLGIASSTFYTHFPSESSEYKVIRDAMEEIKIDLKVSMRNKWYRSTNATLQIALYRMLANPEEHRLLNQKYIDHTTGGEKIPTVDLSGLPDDALDLIYERIKDSASGSSY